MELSLGYAAVQRVGELKDQKQVNAQMLSMVKRNSCGKALAIAREMRDMLGGRERCHVERSSPRKTFTSSTRVEGALTHHTNTSSQATASRTSTT